MTLTETLKYVIKRKKITHGNHLRNNFRHTRFTELRLMLKRLVTDLRLLYDLSVYML